LVVAEALAVLTVSGRQAVVLTALATTAAAAEEEMAVALRA
jgi:hypothetical protein